MAITYRITKGSELTYAEMDENFETLEDAIPLKMGGDAFLHIQDQKALGTHGGDFTSGAWRTRDLNTVLTNTISGASLDSNQITLPAGKYYVEASAPAYIVGGHQGRLYDVAGDSLLGLGSAEYGATSHFVVTRTFLFLVLNLSAETDFELQHRGGNTRESNGFGLGNSFSDPVYSDIRIWRIGEYVA